MFRPERRCWEWQMRNSNAKLMPRIWENANLPSDKMNRDVPLAPVNSVEEINH